MKKPTKTSQKVRASRRKGAAKAKRKRQRARAGH